MGINFTDEVDKAFKGDEAALENVRNETLNLHVNIEAEIHDKLTAVRTDWKGFENADLLYGEVAQCMLGRIVYQEDIAECSDIMSLRQMYITIEATQKSLSTISNDAFFKWSGEAYKDVLAGMDADDSESDYSFEVYNDDTDYTDPNGMR